MLARCVALALTVSAVGVAADTAPPSPDAPAADPSATAAAPAPVAAPAWYTWSQHYLRLNASAAAGHDSNIIEVPGTTPTPSDKGGTFTEYAAAASVLVLDKADVHAHLGADGDLSVYPEYHRLAYMRTGAQAAVLAQDGPVQLGFQVGYDRFYLHYHFYSSSVHPDAYLGGRWGDNVTILGAGFQNDYYVDNRPISGNGLDATLHEWRLLDGDVLTRRVQLGLRAQRYTAHDGVNSYSSFTPSVAASWRFGGARPAEGVIDLKAGISLETRQYDRPQGGIGTSEHQNITEASGSADFWVCPNAALGIFITYTHRQSNVDRDNYDRAQDGVRLSATW
jgi:hypothetical protein